MEPDRRYQEGAAQCERVRELEPTSRWARRCLMVAWRKLGRLDAARDEAVALMRLRGAERADVARVRAGPAAAGLEQWARWSLARLERRAEERHVHPAAFALAYAELGERERAMTALEAAADEDYCSFLPFIGVDPRRDGLRDHPRFEALERRVGLEAAGRPPPPASRTSSAGLRGRPGGVDSAPVGRAARGHEERTRRLASAIERVGLPRSPPVPCPYLPGREARHASLAPAPLLPGVYHSLMDLNFRRAGRVFYRPRCEGCDECRMVRVDVGRFAPSRAQRRCARRNADLEVSVGEPEPDDEKLALYRRYLSRRHDGQMQGTREEFQGFLYSSPVETLELVYKLEGRVVAVGIADAEPDALSAVYCYFDPDLAQRSLGVFNVLRLIEESARRGCTWLYLGFYVAGCGAMSYKAGYRPCELYGAGGVWERRE